MSILHKEIWRKIKNFSYYEISSHCRIKSNKRYPPQIMTQTLRTDGYLSVKLTDDQRKRHDVLVHRIFAETFLVEPDQHYNFYKKRFQRYVVNHKNGNRSDNNPENLEWITKVEDVQHAREVLKTATGWDSAGSNNSHAKLTEKQVIEIRQLLAIGRRKHDLARIYGVSVSTIYSIVGRKTWRHI